MMSNTGYQQHFEPIAARRPPVNETGLMAWIQRGFFDGPVNSLLTVLFVAMLVWAIPPIQLDHLVRHSQCRQRSLPGSSRLRCLLGCGGRKRQTHFVWTLSL